MNKEILIFGRGYLGNRLKEGLNCEISDKRIYTFEDADMEIKKFIPKPLKDLFRTRALAAGEEI